MGYASEVAIRLNKEARDAMTKGIKGVIDSWQKETRELEDGGILYHIAYIKWGNKNPVEKWLFTLDNEDKDECYEFLRVGEGGEEEHYCTFDEEQLRTETSIYVGDCW